MAPLKFQFLLSTLAVACLLSSVDAQNCGSGIGSCSGGDCCSQYGWCGVGDAWCGTGCQSSYGPCSGSTPTTTKTTTTPTPTPASGPYTLVDNWSGSSFFNNFDFFTAGDPTHGFVQYVDQNTAQSNNLLSVNNGVVYIRSDSTNVASSAGRMSIRLTSQKTYNSGLFIFDLNHMPFGCGTWPAIWTVGPNWPNAGEIDIIEGVNTQSLNSMTLHTNAGCTVSGSRTMTGTSVTTDCDVNDPNQASNQGCGVQDTSSKSYGAGFNSNGGGIYAMQWDPSSGIKIWFFARGSIPSDITNNSPNPSGWHTPDASFPFASCPSSHFYSHQIVLDNTFCGDWAGNVFGQSGCSGSCTDFVQNNPSAFTEAYWAINSFKTYQPSSASAKINVNIYSNLTSSTHVKSNKTHSHPKGSHRKSSGKHIKLPGA